MKRLLYKAYFEVKKLVCEIRYKGMEIGKGVVFKKNAKVRTQGGTVSIGNNVVFESNSYINSVSGGKVKIGNNVYFNRNCIIVGRDNITIEDNCMFGPNVCIYDHDHIYTRNGIENNFKKSSVIIEEGSWIAAGCIILRGTHVGKNCVIGAGVTLKGDIPDYSVVRKNSDDITIREILES